jgi:hypothetical protein
MIARRERSVENHREIAADPGGIAAKHRLARHQRDAAFGGRASGNDGRAIGLDPQQIEARRIGSHCGPAVGAASVTIAGIRGSGSVDRFGRRRILSVAGLIGGRHRIAACPVLRTTGARRLRNIGNVRTGCRGRGRVAILRRTGLARPCDRSILAVGCGAHRKLRSTRNVARARTASTGLARIRRHIRDSPRSARARIAGVITGRWRGCRAAGDIRTRDPTGFGRRRGFLDRSRIPLTRGRDIRLRLSRFRLLQRLGVLPYLFVPRDGRRDIGRCRSGRVSLGDRRLVRIL